MRTGRRLLLKAASVVVLGSAALVSPSPAEASAQFGACGICVDLSSVWQCGDPEGYFNGRCMSRCGGPNTITCGGVPGLSCDPLTEFPVSCRADDM